MSKNIKAFGIKYTLPEVHLLHATPLFVSEFGARTCYNSFDKSESKSIQQLNTVLNVGDDIDMAKHTAVQSAEAEVNTNGSDLLHQLSHVYFHESTLEHTSLNFLIKNTSRGVLQELARHRIASFSVQSTRYTMADLINWFTVSKLCNEDANFFINKINDLNMFVTDDREYNAIEIGGMYNKLNHQWIVLGEDKFLELSVAKSILSTVKGFKDEASGGMCKTDNLFTVLSSKTKKNVGDFIKHIITDNVSVDLAFTINLRSLKNFLDLRLSGAAYWQIQLLAHAIYKQIPENYLKLVVKDAKREQFSKLDIKIQSGEWA